MKCGIPNPVAAASSVGGRGQSRGLGHSGRVPGGGAARKGGRKGVLSFSPAPGASLRGGRGVFFPEPPLEVRANVPLLPGAGPLPTQAAARRPLPGLSELPEVPSRTAAAPRAAAQLSLCAPQLRAGETRVGAARRAEPSPTVRGSSYRSGGGAASPSLTRRNRASVGRNRDESTQPVGPAPIPSSTAST